MSDNTISDEDESKVSSKLLKNAYDVQRMKLEKLMKNPTKPVIIPERPKEKKSLYVPDFVRNVMGSSAGAGSGEFHVYRHLRRKEYARQKVIAEMSEKERLDYEFQQKLLENERKAQERTAKKRAKRLKKKAKKKEKLQEKKCKKSDTYRSDNKTDSETPSDNETLSDSEIEKKREF